MENQERKQKILEFITLHQNRPMTKKDLINIMEIPQEDFGILTAIITELTNEGEIFITPKGKLMLPHKLNLLRGTFTSSNRGFGFVTFEDENMEDMFISPDGVNGAMHKDTVLCRITKRKKGKKVEGEIVKVLQRGVNVIVGTFQKNKNFGFVVPDDEKMKDIFIPRRGTKNAVDGHKVVVEITKPAQGKDRAEGKVTEILGHKNDVGVDILSIVRGLEIPTEFPDEVYDQVEGIMLEVQEEDKKGRIDLRDALMVTIDGDDAKDLDDAISLMKLANGNYELGVHIADVTHYVTEDSPLDKEAIMRGTSVYLADRVIPMLPHALSNGICSLNAGVERLALSCTMEIDDKGTVVSHKIHTSLINIDKRMSYKVVNDLLLNAEESEYYSDNEQYIDFFRLMQKVAKILNTRRLERGSIEFDFPESKIIVDKNGKPVDIVKYERNIATNIIEEFMLIANETVAEDYFWQELPFVYRTHEEPDEDKLLKLKDFIGNLGFYFKGKSNHPKSIQGLLRSIRETQYEAVISRYALRSMKQARYSPHNSGHYGLAAKYYSHFTSPIRRYPDLQIHRIIKENLSGGVSEERRSFYKNMLDERCQKCSQFERRAEEAERETIKMKKVEFMQDKIGQEFDGIISGVTAWGIYVELENTVEGMVSVNHMNDDYYAFDEVNLKYIGSKRTYELGGKVRIKVLKADKEARKLDFTFVDIDDSKENE